MTSIEILLLVGAIQGIVLALTLFSIKRGNCTANRILASILVLFSLNIAVHTLTHAHRIIVLPHHQDLLALSFLLIGPLVLFYVRALTEPEFHLRSRNLVHFILFILVLGIYLPYYLSHIDTLSDQGISDTTGRIITWIVIVHITLYLFISYRILRTHLKRIKSTFSSIEKVSLSWLRVLLGGFFVLWIIALFVEFNGGRDHSMNSFWLLVSLLMYLIGYMGLRQPEIFSPGYLKDMPNRNRKKYEGSTLTQDMATQYLNRLIHFMETQKPFRKDLTLYHLAKQLSISPHHLSQIINEKLHQNFFEFVNSYRVEEVKRLIADPQTKHFNITTLGLDAGFQSISAFHSTFKKYTGMTPTQFKRSIGVQ